MGTREKTVAALAVLHLVVAAAVAQESGNTTHLKIHLSYPDCSKMGKLTVIKHGLESHPEYAEKTNGNDCWWHLDLPQFSTRLTTFSVRVPGFARTRCAHAKYKNGDGTLELVPFDRVLQITLKPVPLPPSLLYVRSVGSDDSPLPCDERGDLALTPAGQQHWVVPDVLLPMEKVRLQNFLPSRKPDDEGCGLLVNLLPPVRQAAKKREISNIVDDAAITAAKAAQANRGQNCHIPTQSEALIDVLHDGKHRKLLVEVH
jgi:hypothetical protein